MKGWYRALLVVATNSMVMPAFSQQLTLVSAIDTALNRSYGIVIARNLYQTAVNNNHPGNAGMLPQIGLNAGASKAESQIHQEYSNGNVLDKSGVGATNYTASANLSWTLFDGTKMFATSRRLSLLVKLSDLDLKKKASAVVADVSAAYFELYYQQQVLQYQQQSLELYKERASIAQHKLDLGSSARTEWLQSSVDLKMQEDVVLQQQSNVRIAMIKLKTLLHSTDTSAVTLADSSLSFSIPNKEGWLSILDKGNLDVAEMNTLSDIAEQEYKEAKSYFYPQLVLQSAYSYSESQNTQGFFLQNRSIGPSAGLTFRWNIFNGGVYRHQADNAKYSLENSKYSADDALLTAKGMLLASWEDLATARTIAGNEDQARTQATENLNIMLQRYRLGESNVLDLKEAQKSANDASLRYYKARYDAAIAELQLAQMTGLLFSTPASAHYK